MYTPPDLKMPISVQVCFSVPIAVYGVHLVSILWSYSVSNFSYLGQAGQRCIMFKKKNNQTAVKKQKNKDNDNDINNMEIIFKHGSTCTSYRCVAVSVRSDGQSPYVHHFVRITVVSGIFFCFLSRFFFIFVCK